MRYGHQGANIPVRNVNSGKIEITSQNHFYGLDLSNSELNVTHVSVIDNDVEGFEHVKHKVIGTQLLVVETLNEDENILNRFIKIMKK